MKRTLLMLSAICLLFAGCGVSETPEKEQTVTEPENEVVEQAAPAPEEPGEPADIVYPLPDTTMENLTDAVLSVSLEKGDAYVDDTGKMQMDLKIYTYDLYDAVGIAQLDAGDILVTHSGEVEVTSVARNEIGYVCINGGLDAGGFELAPGDGGTFYEIGYSDVKNWYEIGQATIRVSVDFMGYDNADPDRGEVIIYPGDFLIDAVEDYHFTPHNTTIRVEAGQIVEMNRRYVP